MIRRCLNGETHMSKPHVSYSQYITVGREPGELIDLIERKVAKLETITDVVMDEADEMLNMGWFMEGRGKPDD